MGTAFFVIALILILVGALGGAYWLARPMDGNWGEYARVATILGAAGGSLLSALTAIRVSSKTLENQRRLQSDQQAFLSELEKQKLDLAKRLADHNSGLSKQLSSYNLDISKQLEGHKSDLSKQLEGEKLKYSKELEEHKVQLQSSKSRSEFEFEARRKLVAAAQGYYRTLAPLERGEFDAKGPEAAEQKMIEADAALHFLSREDRDIVQPLWEAYWQSARMISELAEGKSESAERQEVWRQEIREFAEQLRSLTEAATEPAHA